jgi:hypothetical protein
MPRRGLAAIVALITLAACNDVRDFRGGWSGARVGDTPAVRVGIAGDATAALAIASIDRLGLTGTLDGGGDALALIAVYDDDRIEVRLVRGGAQPVYAIFDLAR